MTLKVFLSNLHYILNRAHLCMVLLFCHLNLIFIKDLDSINLNLILRLHYCMSMLNFAMTVDYDWRMNLKIKI